MMCKDTLSLIRSGLGFVGMISLLLLPINYAAAESDMIMDYKQRRQIIEDACFNHGLSTEERYKKLYVALPVTDEQISDLYGGKNDEDMWSLEDTDQGKTCYKMIHNAKSYVPVDMVIKKYQEIMDANPVDIAAITDLKHKISDMGSYGGTNWYSIPEYLDQGIKLPLLPNLSQTFSEAKVMASPERNADFRTKLEQQSDDYVLRFMLLTILRPEGNVNFYNEDFDDKAEKGVAIGYAPPEMVKTFPKWYNAWNKMVPTMCQRVQSYWMDAIGADYYVQKACGDLLSDPKYRLTKQQQEAWDKENTAQYELDDETE